MSKFSINLTSQKAFNAFVKGLKMQREEREKYIFPLAEKGILPKINELHSSGLNSAMEFEEHYDKHYGWGQ